jgi:hypothetical protein
MFNGHLKWRHASMSYGHLSGGIHVLWTLEVEASMPYGHLKWRHASMSYGHLSGGIHVLWIHSVIFFLL